MTQDVQKQLDSTHAGRRMHAELAENLFHRSAVQPQLFLRPGKRAHRLLRPNLADVGPFSSYEAPEDAYIKNQVSWNGYCPSRVRQDHRPQNMDTLRQMSHNLLKRETSLKVGIQGKRLSKLAGAKTTC